MITNTKIKLRDKRLADALNDYIWRTDPELAQLDAAPLLNDSFRQYLLEYSIEMRYPSAIRHAFAIETLEGKHIGNCVYYHIDKIKGEAELGIVIGDRDYWDKGYGTDAVTALVSYIFRQTSLNRIYLKTLTSNQRAQKCFQKCGFTPHGNLSKDGYDFVIMEIHRKNWEEKQPKGGK
jgi:RimJ/RimL family protein N-acetyltransferase